MMYPKVMGAERPRGTGSEHIPDPISISSLLTREKIAWDTPFSADTWS